MKNLLVAQSGGPTAAINATLAGVLDAASKSPEVNRIIGAKNGIEGVFKENFVYLHERIAEEDFLTRLSLTPASALGSCRYKLNTKDDHELAKIVEILRKHEIGYFVYIGGNDSMDTVCKLSEYIQKEGITDIQVVGAPKTIDNDLFGIDHTPGFGSAAKYVATVFSELEREIEVYDVPHVLIVEMMGRNAGWLTASAALAQGVHSSVPYLLYLEERDFSVDEFLEDIREAMKSSGQIMVAVCEGIHNSEGICISDLQKEELVRDAFGHIQSGGVGKILEGIVKEKIGCKVRSIELSLLQRCASHILSETDIRESYALGENAVKLVLQGENGKMSSLHRISNKPYSVEYTSVDTAQIANKERRIPKEWTRRAGITQEAYEYLYPLIQGELKAEYTDGIPRYITLR